MRFRAGQHVPDEDRKCESRSDIGGCVSVQFSSVQDDIYALRKAHMRFTPSLRSFPDATLETVSMLVRLTMALSLKEDR